MRMLGKLIGFRIRSSISSVSPEVTDVVHDLD